MECHETLRAGLGAWLQQEFPFYRVDTAASREQAESMVAGRPPALMLHEKLDQLRTDQVALLLAKQQEQIALLTELLTTSRTPR